MRLYVDEIPDCERWELNGGRSNDVYQCRLRTLLFIYHDRRISSRHVLASYVIMLMPINDVTTHSIYALLGVWSSLMSMLH